MNPNIPLLRKAVEWVEVEAKKPPIECQWNQGDYVQPPELHARILALQGYRVDAANCGTAYCVAGYVGQLLEPGYAESAYVDEVHVSDFAREKLGLDPFQASSLFYGDNSAADVRTIAEEIAGEKL